MKKALKGLVLGGASGIAMLLLLSAAVDVLNIDVHVASRTLWYIVAGLAIIGMVAELDD